VGTYVIRRVLAVFPVIFGLITVVFFLMRLLPGDPVDAIATEWAMAAEEQDKIREDLGLNDPLIVQYFRYLSNLLRGDLGESVFTHRSVTSQILSQLPATLELAVASLLLGVVGGVTIGVLAAAWKDSLFDRIAMFVSLFFIAMPSFWVGLIFIYFFSLRLGWFPVAGSGDLEHLVLPALALGLRPIASLGRVVRTSMLEVLHEDYVTTARAKGLVERRILFVHALRNALIPVVTLLGIYFGGALGGAVIIESVFGRQGVGQLAVGAVQRSDYALVQGTVLFVGTVLIISNLIVDLLYSVIDPRIRYS
jgi:ABC-type dipeptide/oligopeptide/nickel transport system permease component